jgi:hypothetical protein
MKIDTNTLSSNIPDLQALLYAFFLRLDSFLIVVFAQGFVKVALDCLDGRFLKNKMHQVYPH